jgi:heme A synthase
MQNLQAALETASAPLVDPGGERRFALYAWAVLAYNLLVILWGALVRVTGSGAGCGDHWPLCNGVVTPLSSGAQRFIEFTHRAMSGLDLALVAILVGWALRSFHGGHIVRFGAALSGVFLITEAAIGAGLVLLKLVVGDATAWSQSLHLLNTLALLACLGLTAWWASGQKAARLRRRVAWTSSAALVLFALLIVSGVIAALGDTLFPVRSLSEGFAQDFNPSANVFLKLRIWHPVLAVAVALWVLFYALAAVTGGGTARKLGGIVLAIMLFQLAAGSMTLLLLAPLWLQLTHVLLADLLWIAMVLLVAERSNAACPFPGRLVL